MGIVGPGGPLHFALLNIKGEVFDTDVTGALVDPMGQQYDVTITLNYDIGVNYSRTVTRIGTENENNITEREMSMVFCYKDCSNLVWEKIIMGSIKTFAS